MLTQLKVLQKYRSHDYRIRDLDEGVEPGKAPEPDTVFALERGPVMGDGLCCDPLHRPLLFHTEEQVTAHRSALQLAGPVLAFHARPQAEPDLEAAAGNTLDRCAHAAVAAHLGK
ncbi:MAG: hypothetical protein ACLPXB_16955 [Thiobacillaceae bacterium]